MKPTNQEELKLVITQMSNKKSPGYGIPDKLIKIIYNHDPNYFVDIFNLIVKASEIPKSWKIGQMIYFSKPNRKISKPSDLRPITLVNGFCKIAETLFTSRIESELNKLNFFSSF